MRNRVQYTKTLHTGVPQGSVLVPIFHLILINDLANVSDKLFTLLFADDTIFQITFNNINELFEVANLELASDWFKANKLSLNISKTKYMLFRDNSKAHIQKATF